MVKSVSQMKNMIEDWIKVTGVKYIDSTEQIKSKNPQVEWQFVIGQALHVTKMSKRDDRITIHYAIGCPPEITEKFNIKDNVGQELINEIDGFLVLLEIKPNWQTDKDHVIGLDISTYIDEEELSRPLFFKSWDKLLSASNQSIRIMTIRLHPKLSNPINPTDTSGRDIYQ